MTTSKQHLLDYMDGQLLRDISHCQYSSNAGSSDKSRAQFLPLGYKKEGTKKWVLL